MTTDRRMNDTEEKMELKHEPAPGYRKLFFLVLAVCVTYLLIVLSVAT